MMASDAPSSFIRTRPESTGRQRTQDTDHTTHLKNETGRGSPILTSNTSFFSPARLKAIPSDSRAAASRETTTPTSVHMEAISYEH